MSLAHDMMGGHGAPAPGPVAGKASRFSFFTSMADLGRLVARSQAMGLKRRLALALVLVLAGKLAGVIAPLWIGKGIDYLGHGRGEVQAILIAFVGFAGAWVLLNLLSQAIPFIRDSVFTPVSQAALARSAVETFGHSLSLSLNFHQGKQTGSLSRIIDRGARSTDFLLRSVVLNLGPTAVELAMASWVLSTRYDWRLAIVANAVIVIYVVFTFSISNWRIKHRRDLNQTDSEAAGLVVDSLMNFETIKTFGSEGRVVASYAKAMGDYATAAVKANTSLQLLNTVQSVVLSVGRFLVVVIAALSVLHHQMTPGSITACILILQTVYGPLNVLGMQYREIRQAFVDMEQMLDLRAVAPEIVDAPDARPLPPASGQGADLVFRGVGFQHTARAVGLTDISFEAPPGTTTALVGPSGSGKTTIARLALRLIDPQAGQVLIDGVDLRQVRQEDLRGAVALVPQDVALFNDTLYANLAFADPSATPERVWAAAEAAELAKFIRDLPQQMDTKVGERGLKLSGGERQRVGLARALLANPRLLILDEATSALDGRTEAAIQATLRKVRAGRTTLVVAHRLSTIADADQILVIRRGKIVERGDHAALLANGGEYAALWRRQTRSEATRPPPEMAGAS